MKNLLILIVLFAVGCSHPLLNPSEKSSSKKFEQKFLKIQIPPQPTSAADVEILLGKPDESFDSDNIGGQLWFYRRGAKIYQVTLLGRWDGSSYKSLIHVLHKAVLSPEEYEQMEKPRGPMETINHRDDPIKNPMETLQTIDEGSNSNPRKRRNPTVAAKNKKVKEFMENNKNFQRYKSLYEKLPKVKKMSPNEFLEGF